MFTSLIPNRLAGGHKWYHRKAD